ncbi:MAG: hypothetical protein CM15mP77_3280 [Synechococcus sp.]|nr:MAG: hypothetical protein CM15mP77_3280 [Synechococcus sp.]
MLIAKTSTFPACLASTAHDPAATACWGQAMEKQRGEHGSAPPAGHRPHPCRQSQRSGIPVSTRGRTRLGKPPKDLSKKNQCGDDLRRRTA